LYEWGSAESDKFPWFPKIPEYTCEPLKSVVAVIENGWLQATFEPGPHTVVLTSEKRASHTWKKTPPTLPFDAGIPSVDPNPCPSTIKPGGMLAFPETLPS
jgi:hypothetical protein